MRDKDEKDKDEKVDRTNADTCVSSPCTVGTAYVWCGVVWCGVVLGYGRYANDEATAAAAAGGGGAAGERVAALLCSAPLHAKLVGWATSLRKGDAAFGVNEWRSLLQSCVQCLGAPVPTANATSVRVRDMTVTRAREAAAIRSLFLATFEACEDKKELEQAVPVATESLIAILKEPECLLPSPAPTVGGAATGSSGGSTTTSGSGSASTTTSDSGSNTMSAANFNVVEMMGSRAVQQLAQPSRAFPTVPVKSPNSKKPVKIEPHALYAIVRALCAGNFKDFKKVVTGKGGVRAPRLLKEIGISEKDALDTMRLIALACLPKNIPGAPAAGAAIGAHELSYADIADALEIKSDDIEAWIVRAVRDRLLEAKLDQMKKVVTVTRHTQCSFETEDWTLLQQRLAAWQLGVTNTSAALQSDIVPKASVDVAPPTGIGAN